MTATFRSNRNGYIQHLALVDRSAGRGLIFGTKKLANIGSDLGKAVRGFKDGVKSDEEAKATAKLEASGSGQTIDGEVKEKSKG